MEYEKKVYCLECENSDEKKFIYLEKRADKLILSIKHCDFQSGELCVYSNGHYQFFDVNSQNAIYELNDEFSYFNDYFFVFFCENIFSNELSWCLNENNIFNELSKHHTLKKNMLKINQIQNDNIVIDEIMLAMFEKNNVDFFDYNKSHFENLFLSFNRFYELEKIINNSKFVISSNKENNFVAGIIYRNNIPYAVGIGATCKNITLKNAQKFELPNGENIFLNFRKASDGFSIII